MPDYQNGKIYTIRCKSDNTLIYVGSTITTLSRRLAEHKSKSKKYNTRKIYQSINDNWDDFYIELYEVYPCENKEQLNKREGEITREIGTLNYQIAGRTPMEWRDDNIDKVKLAQQEYNKNNAEKLKLAQQEYNKNNFEKLKLARQKNYTNNFEKIQEQTKLYRENNKDKKREQDKLYHENNQDKLNEQSRERGKRYRVNNTEKIKEQTKLYRENNAEKIKEKITCECGCILTKYGLPRHLKSKKHIEALNPM